MLDKKNNKSVKLRTTFIAIEKYIIIVKLPLT